MITLRYRAIPDLALFAMTELDAWLHATGAVDHVDRDAGRTELFHPFFGGFKAQRIIIGYGGDPGLAGCAVMPQQAISFSMYVLFKIKNICQVVRGKC